MPAQVGAHEDLVLLDDQPEHADDGSLGLGRKEAPLLAGDPVEQRQIVGVRRRMRDEPVAGDRRLVDVEGADQPDDRLAIGGESRPDPDRPAHEAVRSTASRNARTGPRPPASSTLTWSTPGSVTKRFGSGAAANRRSPSAIGMTPSRSPWMTRSGTLSSWMRSIERY